MATITESELQSIAKFGVKLGLSDDPMPERQNLTDWFGKNWFWLAALFSVGAAWGQVQSKLTALEQATADTARSQAQIAKINESLAAMEERARGVAASQARQERLLELLLQQKTAYKQKKLETTN